MLSRVADNLYWASRYLERAEHTARVLDVNLDLMLDQSPALAAHRYERLLKSLSIDTPLLNGDRAPMAITRRLSLDPATPESITACVASARENARQIREWISSEMWEQVNCLNLRLRGPAVPQQFASAPQKFFQELKEGVQLFNGIADATMNHGQGWRFLQLGRYLERAINTAALIDAHFLELRDSGGEATVYLDWIGLLRSATSFEAYCKTYSQGLEPDRIAEFLLLNAQSPRSVAHCADRIAEAVACIGADTSAPSRDRLERLAGRLRASLAFNHISEVMASGFHQFLMGIQQQCFVLHDEIKQTYIAYPIAPQLAG